MSVNVGIADLSMLLEEPDLDPEDVEEFRDTYAALDAFLRGRGLPGHREPESLPRPTSSSPVDSFPYSWVDALRRAYVHALPASAVHSHLLGGPVEEGFYVPVVFERPLVATEDEDVLGGVVGSSFALLDELVALAPHLGIELQNGQLPAAVAVELGDPALQGEHPLGTERLVWLIYYEAAVQSIEWKSAIRVG